MSSEAAVRIENLSKCYAIYEAPRDRLKQFILPRLQRCLGRSPKPYYQEFWALKDLNIEVRRGETVGIVGRNGSGKSTLLQLICGTLNPTSGVIHTRGRIAALLELGAGFSPEFTGRENVFMNGAILGLSREDMASRLDDIIAFADIGAFIDRPVKTYSSGMVVRLAFAVAVNIDPEILIVDEALSVGDELFQRKCFARIEAIRASGATILFVSHSAAQVIELCHRAVLMDEGEVLAVGAPKEIVVNYLRLLHAPESKRAAIRRDVIEGAKPNGSPESSGVPQGSAGEGPSLRQGEETYDPDLVPSSTIDYDPQGASIESPALFTLQGERVNGLVRGRRYVYRYRVSFSRPATNVRFGMSIRTTTGFGLGGALSASAAADCMPFVAQGQVVEVEFAFCCSLNTGVYFMNAGVFELAGDQERVLHRRIDALAFRVLPVGRNIETSVVSFDVEPRVKL